MKIIEQWKKSPFDALRPTRVLATIVAGCNLSCEHCYWSHDIHEQSTRDWSGAIDRLKELNVPLIYAGRVLNAIGIGFLESYRTTVNSKFDIIDNGWSILKRPSLLPSYDQITISIDGWREGHDRQRGRVGAFDVSWSTVKSLRGMGYDPVIAAALSPITVPNWHRFESLLAEHDVPLSCTLVWALPETVKRGGAVLGGNEALHIFEMLLKGIPKLINLYALEHIAALTPVLKQFRWLEGDDCLTTKLPSGTVVICRPASVVAASEIDLRWDGKLYTSLVNTVQCEVGQTTRHYWSRVNHAREEEHKVWQQIL